MAFFTRKKLVWMAALVAVIVVGSALVREKTGPGKGD